MRIKDKDKKRTAKDELSDMLSTVATEKGLSKKELADFMAKIVLVEAGTSLNPKQKQYNNGPGRGLAQWENNQGSNRVVSSLQRTINYYKDKGKKIPSFIKEAFNTSKKEGTYDITNLNKDQQLVVLLGDLRMGAGDLSQIKNGDKSQFEFWRKHWWQGKEEDVPAKKKYWKKRNKTFQEKRDYVYNKLYDGYDIGNGELKEQTKKISDADNTTYIKNTDGSFSNVNPEDMTFMEEANKETAKQDFHKEVIEKYRQNSKKLKTQQNKKNFINSILELTNVHSVNQMQQARKSQQAATKN